MCVTLNNTLKILRLFRYFARNALVASDRWRRHRAVQEHQRTNCSEFAFPAKRGDGHIQGIKSTWSRAIKKAQLPGVTPHHTPRHAIGSTVTPTGEALALTEAILGHANPRSTAICAHVPIDPSRWAAERVRAKIAAALAGERDEAPCFRQPVDAIEAMVRSLVERLVREGFKPSAIGPLVSQPTPNRPAAEGGPLCT